MRKNIFYKIAARKGLYILLLIIITFINVLTYSRGQYLFGINQYLVLFNSNTFYNGFFAFTTFNYSGYINGTYSLFALAYRLVGTIAQMLGGVIFANIIAIWFYYVIGAIGMFLLITKLLEKYPIGISYFSGFVSALLFVLNFDSHNGSLEASAMFLPFVLLTSILFLESVEKRKPNLKLLALMTLSIAILFDGGGAQVNVLQNIIFVALFALVFLYFARRQFRIVYTKYYSIVAFLVFLWNIAWVYLAYITISRAGSQLFNNTSVAIFSSASLNILQSLFSFGVIVTASTAPIILIIYFVILTLSIIGALIFLKKASFSDLKHRSVFALLICYIIFVSFNTGLNKPFGILFNAILNRFSYLDAFRQPYISFHYVLLFVSISLFGVGIGALFGALQSRKKTIANFLFLCLVISIVISYVYLFDYLKIINSHSIPGIITENFNPTENNSIAIPNYVFQISNFINTKYGNFAIATLPVGNIGGGQCTSWYYSTTVYSNLVNHPTYTGGATDTFELFFPSSYYLYGLGLRDEVNASNLGNMSLSNGFGVFGIEYMIVQGDIRNCNTNLPINLTNVYNNLGNASNISFVTQYNATSIYENTNYVPLVYGSNLVKINESDLYGIIHIIENQNFNIKNTSVYSMLITNGTSTTYNGSGRNPSTINNFHNPQLTFLEKSPTKVVVNVYNASTPFYLVFRESYDPSWTAIYANGTKIASNDHLEVNGFANAWYINKKGKFTLSLYYNVQTTVWLLWIPTLGALFGILSLMCFGVRKRKS